MNSTDREKLNEVRREDIVWEAYIFVAIFALISNKIEKDYIYTHNAKKHREFHNLNVFLLTIGLIIYIYFLTNAYDKYKKDPQKKNNYLTVIATFLFLIGGIILLTLEIEGADEPDVL